MRKGKECFDPSAAHTMEPEAGTPSKPWPWAGWSLAWSHRAGSNIMRSISCNGERQKAEKSLSLPDFLTPIVATGCPRYCYQVVAIVPPHTTPLGKLEYCYNCKKGLLTFQWGRAHKIQTMSKRQHHPLGHMKTKRSGVKSFICPVV